MRVDYFSDPHFDFYFLPKNLDFKSVFSYFKTIFKDKKSDILIIAGDLGHYNQQTLFIMKIIKEHFYKHIICVLGNHDYYMIDDETRDKYNNNSFNRVKELREDLNKEDGIYCLNGNAIEIEGIRFGGCDSWYDGSYMKRLPPHGAFMESSINELWKNSLNDNKFIFDIERYRDIFDIELPKIKRVYQECDVMITHVNPSSRIEHALKKYSRSKLSAFFAFDGEEFMANGSMKYWIYGHIHNENEYEIAGVKALCNPMGYPYENLHFKLKSFEI